jgi:hypothetical protein
MPFVCPVNEPSFFQFIQDEADAFLLFFAGKRLLSLDLIVYVSTMSEYVKQGYKNSRGKVIRRLPCSLRDGEPEI